MAISANAVTRFGLGGAMWQPQGSYANKEEGVIVSSGLRNKDGAGSKPLKERKVPKKFKSKKLENLIEALMAERNAVKRSEKVIGYGYIQIDEVRQRKVENLTIELKAVLENLAATTKFEIAYQNYIYKIIRDLEQKYKQAMEDELIAILLLML